MILAKKPIEVIFSLLTSAKQAFGNLKRVTVFIVDINLQYEIMHK